VIGHFTGPLSYMFIKYIYEHSLYQNLCRIQIHFKHSVSNINYNSQITKGAIKVSTWISICDHTLLHQLLRKGDIICTSCCTLCIVTKTVYSKSDCIVNTFSLYINPCSVAYKTRTQHHFIIKFLIDSREK